MKAFLFSLLLLSGFDHVAFAQCPLCGDGFALTLPDTVVSVGGQTLTCAQLEGFAQGGQIPSANCAAVTNMIFDDCGCNATGIPPTEAPTFGPAPDCFEDLDNIRDRERATTDVSETRTYVLCPNKVYQMGQTNEMGQIVGGFETLQSRPNVHYKCGDDGSSANDCIIKGGEIAVAAVAGDAVHSNVIFEGLTIDGTLFAGVLINKPGDITFLNCVFRGHQNLAPVLSLYPTNARRELEADGKDDHLALLDMALENSFQEGELELPASDNDRNLQVTTMTLTFRKTVFENNMGAPPELLSGVRPGIVNVQFPETILVFEEVIFQNNDYSNAQFSDRSWAINTVGPLTITDSCFIDNQFLWQGPVVTFLFPPVEATNNFGTIDENLECEFLIEFPNALALESLVNYTCTQFDADTCAAEVTETEPPQPTPSPISPTRPPRVTAAPTMMPVASTPAPQAAEPTIPSGSDGYAGPNLLFVLFSLAPILAALLV